MVLHPIFLSVPQSDSSVLGAYSFYSLADRSRRSFPCSILCHVQTPSRGSLVLLELVFCGPEVGVDDRVADSNLFLPRHHSHSRIVRYIGEIGNSADIGIRPLRYKAPVFVSGNAFASHAFSVYLKF